VKDSLHSRIRVLRLQQQRTLKDIADSCGFTVSLLSKIESGKSTPPVATLTKIAKALGTSVGSLLEEGKESSTVLTPASKLGSASSTRTDKGYTFHLLAAERSGKAMHPFLFVAERGKVLPGPMSHSGEEFVHVLSGRMRYHVGEITYTLGPGDSLYFDAEERHDLEPITAEVRYLAIFVERNAKRSAKKS
jgi:transcriptional regulator with XRE-family HTH domain